MAAITSATIAGSQNAGVQSASEVANECKPQAARAPPTAAPTLWAVFQIDIKVPRSDVENQWTTTRPEGGQPMPWNQPLMNMTVAKIATEALIAGTNATKRFTTADSARPSGRKYLALALSESMAMKNLDRP